MPFRMYSILPNGIDEIPNIVQKLSREQNLQPAAAAAAAYIPVQIHNHPRYTGVT